MSAYHGSSTVFVTVNMTLRHAVIQTHHRDLIVLNLPNCDIVGTGRGATWDCSRSAKCRLILVDEMAAEKCYPK